MYSADMGRPNRAVQTLLGVLVLKEMFDLTDIEALEELEFNLLWHHALGWRWRRHTLRKRHWHNFPRAVDGARRGAVGVLRDDGPDDRGSGSSYRQAAR